ncbi:hypothetical protein N7491_009731 [Penicillium cf. griseofulvum]|nr:hypothetical protein N7491_009731 [Penicillium cf. griseofulvum]
MGFFFSHLGGISSTTAHINQCISSIFVLGITAWAVRKTKSPLIVIFSLVVAVLTPIVYGITLSTNGITKRYRWHVLPLLLTDAVISYLYDNMKHPFYSKFSSSWL